MAPKMCCVKFDKQCTRFLRKRKYSISSWSMANYLRRKRCGWYYIPDIEVLLGAYPTLFVNDGMLNEITVQNMYSSTLYMFVAANSRIQQDDEQTSPADQEISETNCDNSNLI